MESAEDRGATTVRAITLRREEGERGESVDQCELLSVALVAKALPTSRAYEVLDGRRDVARPPRCGVGELCRINVDKVLIEGLPY